MRLPFRHKDDLSEVPCPRCKVPLPAEDLECNLCGWDVRDAYREPDVAAADSAVPPPDDPGGVRIG